MKWISVQKIIPETHSIDDLTIVLVYSESHGIQSAYYHNNSWYLGNIELLNVRIPNVTHWMSLEKLVNRRSLKKIKKSKISMINQSPILKSIDRSG